MNVVIPLNKKVIIRPEAKEKKTKGGIVIPEVANQQAPTKGTVIAVADDAFADPSGVVIKEPKVVPGDIILFSKFAGIELTLKGTAPGEADQELLIMDADKIMAKLEVQEAT